VTNRVKHIPARSLDALEKSLKSPLPLGYREYLTHLGVGIFSEFLTVYSPLQVKANLRSWRKELVDAILDGISVGSYKNSAMSAKQLRESIFIASTCNGDDFVSTPSCGQTLFAIPNRSGSFRRIRNGFLDPIACCRAVGVPVHAYFEARNNRRRLCNFVLRRNVRDLENALSERWGKIRRFEETHTPSWVWCAPFGVPSIEGLVKLYSGRPGPRIVTMSYDKEFARDVRAFVATVGVPKATK
jgi:hypothetical protein